MVETWLLAETEHRHLWFISPFARALRPVSDIYHKIHVRQFVDDLKEEVFDALAPCREETVFVTVKFVVSDLVNTWSGNFCG